jgi:ABC-type transport system substrate-binding protein
MIPHTVRAQPQGKLTPGLHITMIAPTSNPARRAWASIVQNNLNALGINASLVYLPFSPDVYDRVLIPSTSKVGKTYDQGGYDLLFVGYSLGIDPDPYSLYHSSQFAPAGQNYYLWNNTQNDNLTTLVKNTLDASTRNNYVRQWQVLAYNELPSIPILYSREIVPFDSKIINGQQAFNAYHYPAWPSIEHLTTPANAPVILAQAGQAPGMGVVPELSSSYYDFALSGEIFGALAIRNDTLFKTMVPQLASGTPAAPGWSVAADGKTWTVNLRQGVKWHDGSPFTATDVKFTFDMYLNDTFGSPTESFVASIIGSKSNVVMTGPYSLQFSLPSPYSYFVQNILSSGILPEHILNSGSFYGGSAIDYSKIKNSLFNHPDTGTGGVRPIGTGPYKWADYNAGTMTSHLVRNDNYFNFSDWGKDSLQAKGQFTVKDYYLRTIVGAGQAITALQSGEVDILDSQYHLETQPAFLNQWGSNKFAVYDAFGVQELGVNMQHPILGTGVDTPLGKLDPSKAALAAKYVRQAISYAIPRREIINTLLNGYGTPAITTAVPLLSNGFNTQLKPYEYNLTKAAELLKQAGYTMTMPDFSVTASGPVTFLSGQTSTTMVTLTSKDSFFGLVSLSTSVDRTGLTVNCPTSLALTSSTVNGNCILSSDTPGNYLLSITGISGSLSHQATVAITVTSPPPPPPKNNFSLSLSTTHLTLQQGSSAHTMLTVKGIHFSGLVKLKATITPLNHEGLALHLSKNRVILSSDKSAIVLVTIRADDDIPAGDYVITITGTSNTTSHIVRLSVTIVFGDNQNQDGEHWQFVDRW